MNISVIKNVTDHDVKRVEAFNIDKNDKKAKFPEQNFKDIVPLELKKKIFSTLILQGGTHEISNLDVSGPDVVSRIEELKNEVKESSTKLFKLAEESLEENKDLKRVIIFKTMFRCDTLENDPSQLKAELSEYGNRVLDDMWLSMGCPKNIHIVKQDLDCPPGELRFQRFGSPSNPAYDGIHLRGVQAVQHYTGSIVKCLLKVIPNCATFRPNPVKPMNVKEQRFNHTPRYWQNQPNYIQAQPQRVPRASNSYPYQHHTRNVTTPATGANRTPVGGQTHYKNIRVQNRFSQLSGNF